jgi:hypothetical protein
MKKSDIPSVIMVCVYALVILYFVLKPTKVVDQVNSSAEKNKPLTIEQLEHQESLVEFTQEQINKQK